MRNLIQQVIVSSVTSNFTIPSTFPSAIGLSLEVEVNGLIVPHFMTSATALTIRTPTLAKAIVNFYETDNAYQPTNLAQVSLDFPSIAANSNTSLTVTVKGAVVGQGVVLGLPNTVPAGVIYQGFVSAVDTVTVLAFNVTAGAIDPPAANFRVLVK